MKIVPRPKNRSNSLRVLILVLAFIIGAATACLATGCNTVTRAALGAGQGLVDDCRSAYRHAGDQLRNADRDTRSEESRLEGGVR